MKLLVFFELLKQDLKERSLGTLLGIFWSFFVPLITILVMWIVFEYGFHKKSVDGYPYSVWYLAGIIPWLYFAETFVKATNSIKSKSFLIKKTYFDPILLPIITIFSNLFIYIFLILFLIAIYLFEGFKVDIFLLQILYYIFCLVIFLIGISLITSSLVLFIKDINEIVLLIVRFGMWLTPIFWSINLLPSKYRVIYYFNPIYYIIEGFRDSLLYKRWFFEKISTVYFWIITLIILYIGYKIFNKLRVYFGDVV
jgi:ABC-type polysaccharide/polyol phosphate export permease